MPVRGSKKKPARKPRSKTRKRKAERAKPADFSKIVSASSAQRCGAPIGNRFWMLRSRHGPNPKFRKAQDLYEACCGYFEWVELNPLSEEKIAGSPDGPVHVYVAKMRPMTLGGLCLAIGISQQTWRDWRKAGGDHYRNDLAQVIEWVETVIWTQKFEGAAAGLLNGNIISRDLGLIDKTERTHEAGDTLTAFLREIAQAPLFGQAA